MAEAIATLLAVLSEQVAAQAPQQSAQVEALRAEVAALQARLERLESHAASRRAGPAQAPSPGPAESPGPADQPARGGRRRATSSARRAQRSAKAAQKGQRRRRTPKEEVRARALEAGRALAAQGKTVNLTTVADAAGLNYGQVTYAFRRKENLLKELGLLNEGQDGQVE